MREWKSPNAIAPTRVITAGLGRMPHKYTGIQTKTCKGNLTMNDKKKLTWLLFHEPAELFIRTAEHFGEEINKLTGDKYEIEILKLDEYNDIYNNGKPTDPMAELRAGRVQMSQLYTNSLAQMDATDFFALALPFLFKDHDHCTRVLEGEIGDELRSHVHDKLNVRSLSFTYSGGYKCMASDKPVVTVEDFASMTAKYVRSPVFAETFKALGMGSKDSDANTTQTTLPRYHVEASASQKHVNFKEAAKICARAERIKSVADADEIKNDVSKQAERGIESIGDLSEAESEKLRAKLVPVTDKFAKFFGNDLVDRIRKS